MRHSFSNVFAGILLACSLAGTVAAQDSADRWQLALPGWQYVFPADHAVHPSFKTEWWYFTGNLQSADGHPFGYELTFFREGVIPPSRFASDTMRGAADPPSRFVQPDFKFAHFAISDIGGARFTFTQKISRGAFGEAGFGVPPARGSDERPALPRALAWMEDWKLEPQEDGTWRISARADETSPPMAIDLTLKTEKPPVIEGTDGVSQKSSGVGNASHYYSFTRLRTSGTLSFGTPSSSHQVQGESWFDHEWASNQLAADQIGWNWFCFQFDDQTELMLYVMRRKDGSADPASSGTLIDPAGNTEHLQRDQLSLKPVRFWCSAKTGANYPVAWQVSIPSHGLNFSLEARLDDQELVIPPISYWEGAITARGTRTGNAISGAGYMELTGYAGALKGLQQESSDPAPDLRAVTH